MSKSTCPNCSHPITCGCQKRTASDGTQVCASCLAAYEAKIKAIATGISNLPSN